MPPTARQASLRSGPKYGTLVSSTRCEELHAEAADRNPFKDPEVVVTDTRWDTVWGEVGEQKELRSSEMEAMATDVDFGF